MAAELLVFGNPGRKARRRRASTTRRKVRRNPARRKLTAKQAKYFGKRSAKKATRRRRGRSLAVAVNPTRRVARRRSVRRNPSMSLGSFKPEKFLSESIIPASMGAAGALALDVALGYAAPHLPAALTTGQLAPALTKIAGAVGLGMATQMVTKDRHLAAQVTAGALIVTMYGITKKFMAAQFPSVPGLNGMGVYVHGLGYSGAARAFPDGGMGVYVPGGGGSVPLAPAVIDVVNMQRRNSNQAPVGLHGSEYSEGGYQYT